MNNTMITTIDESKTLPDVKDTTGWYEYEPSYDGVVTHINTAGARLFGFTSPDDVIGKKINELYAHPFDHEKTLSMLLTMLSEKRLMSCMHIPLTTKKHCPCCSGMGRRMVSLP